MSSCWLWGGRRGTFATEAQGPEAWPSGARSLSAINFGRAWHRSVFKSVSGSHSPEARGPASRIAPGSFRALSTVGSSRWHSHLVWARPGGLLTAAGCSTRAPIHGEKPPRLGPTGCVKSLQNHRPRREALRNPAGDWKHGSGSAVGKCVTVHQ